MDYCKNVDVFYGSGKICLPEPSGIAESWYFIKAICGNTHPGAVLPFGRLSAGCYCGGYPTGYGNHRGNSSPGNLRTFGDKMQCRGFSHIHESGTGAMDIYYNYAVTVPFYSDLVSATYPQDMADETARPGYYAVTLPDRGIRAELTVSETAAIHRYTFDNSGGRVLIDLSNDGFINDDPKHRGYSESSHIKLIDNKSFEARVVMKGLPLYIYGVCDTSIKSVLWRDYLPEKNETELNIEGDRDDYGVAFSIDGKMAEIRLSISTQSIDKARHDVLCETRSFDEIAEAAYKKWNSALSKIDVDAPSESDREIFYSNFYHTLVKPSDWSGENFLNDEEAFITDFATMWDMYKTQLPLVFSLYPEMSEKIIATFSAFCESEGTMPHTFTLTNVHKDGASSQARMLAEHSIADAYYRGVRADYHRAVQNSRRNLFSEPFESFHSGDDWRATHTVDIAEGCSAMARLCGEIGEDSAVFEPFRDKWKDVFDLSTGLMKEDSDYYEGSCWNFSFRPMSDMAERIRIAGGRENFIKLLDRFFGYTDAHDTSARFEGFNNESDMESFVSYYYVGRSDRICEISDAALNYMFTTGRGGLPGNNDSGGLSSLCMWLQMGVFPVAGQNLMIIGSPRMNKTVMHLASGKDFEIIRKGGGIYVKSAYLNGEKLTDLSFPVSEMMLGGVLTLEMSENID